WATDRSRACRSWSRISALASRAGRTRARAHAQSLHCRISNTKACHSITARSSKRKFCGTPGR
ncbi:MAG: hypothetical protein AVDCRST_MAG39-578, partial [uncultured Sphingomonadaceae bacterium]